MEQSSSDLPVGLVALFSPLLSPMLSTQAEVTVGLLMLRKEVVIFFSLILVHLEDHHQTTYQVVHAVVAAVQRVVAQKVGYYQILVSVVVEARYLHVGVTSFSWC